jgi:hypothetical protein
MKGCDFCGIKTDEKVVLRDTQVFKKDGSDLVLFSDCLNNYLNGDYDKRKLKELETK